MPNRDGSGPIGQNRKFLGRRRRDSREDSIMNQSSSNNFRNRGRSFFRNQNSSSDLKIQIDELKERINSLEKLFHNNK
jgi:hypothetical protein